MSTKNDMRLTINIPKEEHIKLKIRAAALGKSMRDVILDSLKETEECDYSSHYPNKETLKILANIEKGKDLVGAKEGSEFLKKLASK